LYNHKECTYRAPIRYVTKTWSVVLLNKKKKYVYSYLKCIVYDKLLKPRQSFRITPYRVFKVKFQRLKKIRRSSNDVDYAVSHNKKPVVLEPDKMDHPR